MTVYQDWSFSGRQAVIYQGTPHSIVLVMELQLVFP